MLHLWQPGDRIFLFGFSRGAYTVRCLAAVIGLCGIPRAGKDGKPLRLDQAYARAVAKVAVQKVYQHVSSPRDEHCRDQRKARADWFRDKYGSENVYPYFIGVFEVTRRGCEAAGLDDPDEVPQLPDVHGSAHNVSV